MFQLIADFIIVVLLVATLNYLRSIAMDVATILAQIATISTEVDALVAASKPVDLQPVADALTALSGKVTAATPAP